MLPVAIAAVITGHISYSHIKRSAGRLTGQGMALAGMILGYLGIVLVIVAALVMPDFTRVKNQANELSARASLRLMNEACFTYNSIYNTFPPRQSDLGPVPAGDSGKAAAGLLEPALAPPSGTQAVKDGYIFQYTAGAPDPKGVITTYSITADPQSPKRTGVRRFYVDQTGVIRFTSDGSAPTSSSPSSY